MNQPNNMPGAGRRLEAGANDAWTSTDARTGTDARTDTAARTGTAAGSGAGARDVDQQLADTDRLLRGVEGDLESLRGKDTHDQVPVFDRIHSALADALARTADTGGPPAAGHQGA